MGEKTNLKQQILGLSAQARSSCGLGLSRRLQWEDNYVNKEYVKENQRATLRVVFNCPNVREIKQQKGKRSIPVASFISDFFKQLRGTAKKDMGVE